MNRKSLKVKKLIGIVVILIVLLLGFLYFGESEKNSKRESALQNQETEDQVTEEQATEEQATEETTDEIKIPQETLEKVVTETPEDQTKDAPIDSKVVMCTPEKEIEAVIPKDEDFVKVIDYIPSIYVELKYATEDNFTGTLIYDFSDAYLRYGTVKKLMLVQEILEKNGCSLKIWDAFRPVAAQFVLWEVYPDATYVANPNSGYSSHSRGNTLDVTIVLIDGSEVQMPTEFDDFSLLADRDYSDIDQIASQNATLLETVMKEQGFNAYQGEWWHFSDSVKYSVDENFNP